MSPYFCYFHQGLYERKPDGADGCNNQQCLEFAAKEVKSSGIHYTGHGVKQGVSPDQVSVKASEKALKQAEAVA
jgi:hypothetical protein